MPFNFKNLSVLIVDETAPMRKLIASVLDTLEVGKVLQASDSDRAFQMFCDERPDMVLTEWALKPKNGIELTKEIRTNPTSPNTMTPIIIITGYAAATRVEMARDSGITEYLAKPFSASDLAKRIAYVINNPRDFINSDDYFGPDRRRQGSSNYSGPLRRADD